MLCIKGFPYEYLRTQLYKQGCDDRMVGEAIDYLNRTGGYNIKSDYDYEIIKQRALKSYNNMQKLPINLSFIIQPHPPEYRGFPQLSIFEYFNLFHIPDGGIDAIKRKDRKTLFVVCDNLEAATQKRFGKKCADISLLNLTFMDDKFVFELLSEWKEQEPISMFCELKGYTNIVKNHWMVINSSSIITWIGKLYYFKPTRPKIKKYKNKENNIKRRKQKKYIFPINTKQHNLEK